MLLLDHIHTYYDQSHVLQGVSLTVPRGSVVALLGRNGMGKTTTIHSIIGFQPPRSGDILFKGKSIAGLPPYQIARQGIALVPQGKRVFPSLTVYENLFLAQRQGADRQIKKQQIDEIYKIFPVLEKRAQHYSRQLSGGEQTMLSIARAFISKPNLILMDEPFEGLAPMIIRELQQKVLQLKASGIAILLVEQSIQSVLDMADYVYIMNKGRIIYESEKDSLRQEGELVRQFLTFGHENIFNQA